MALRRLCLAVSLTLLLSFSLGWAEEVLGPNLAPNGSFAEGTGTPTGWSWGLSNGADASLALDATVTHAGHRSLRFSSRTPASPHVYGGLSTRVSGLAPRSEYVIRLWAKGQGAGLIWFGGGPAWATRRFLPQGDFDWQQFEVRWTAPANPEPFELRLNIDGVTTALWVTDVSFQEVNPIALVPRVTTVALADATAFGCLPLARLAQAPKLDGDLADWPADTPVVKLPEDCGRALVDDGGSALSNPPTVALRAGWDARALYLGVVVRDPKHWAPAGAPMWQNDSLQIALDPRHERTAGGYGPADSEYSLALDNDGKTHVDCWQTPQGLGNRAAEIRLAVQRQGDLTTYEAALPWSAVGVPLASGSPRFGFSMLANDSNGDGRRGYVELTPGIGKTKDPSRFLTAVDAGAGSLTLSVDQRLVYVGDGIALRALYCAPQPVAAGTRCEFSCRPAKGAAQPLSAVSLPAGKQGLLVVETTANSETLPVGPSQLECRVSVAGTAAATASCDLTVSDAKRTLAARAEALRKKLAAVTALAERCEARRLGTDYERVAITAVADFIGYALEDAAHDRVPRAQHVLEASEQALEEAADRLNAYLSGRAKPLLVPRVVLGPTEVRDGAFWADTVVPQTGVHAKRPVFYTGYGHFGRVVTDLPKFPALGANIIQIEMGPWSTQPEEGVVTDQAVRDYIGKGLAMGEQYGVAVCWLASPHYFPNWALKKWPELTGGGGGFIGYRVDAPQARQILQTHLETALGAIKASPALHSVCLTNEPTYTQWTDDPFRRPLWHQYLQRVHGTIAQLNAAYGSQYASFDEVPVLPTATLPAEPGMTPLRYDEARFNMEQFAAYHQFMGDVVHRVRPGTPVHAKVMCMPSGRQNINWGCDPEQFAWMGDLNGNDCWMMFGSFGDNYAGAWMAQNLYYDLQRSMRRVPIFNTENHIIVDREQRLIPPVQTDCALWMGAIHGQGAETTWVWERTYERTHDFEGSILHRPENVIAHGRAGLDLLRLAPEVVKLQQAQAPVAILYSLTAQIWSDRAFGAMHRAYEALNFTGLPVAFISEKQAARGGLKRYRAIVLPAVRHVPQAVADALLEYARGGGKLWVLGDEALARDEYNRPRQIALPAAATTVWAENMAPTDLRAAMLQSFAVAGVTRSVRLTGSNGAEPWAVEYRAARDGSDTLLSVVNFWGLPQKVRLTVDGRPARRVTDLRSGRVRPAGRLLTGDSITLEPLRAMLLRVE